MNKNVYNLDDLYIFELYEKVYDDEYYDDEYYEYEEVDTSGKEKSS